MNKRKIMVMAMALAMCAILVVGGTLAYFTDDEQKTNTMVIGNVAINIEENVKVEDENGNWVYDEFVDDEFTMYPVDSDTVYEDLNAHYNKVVRTFNTSPSKDDAYIRTIILFEKNDLLPANYANQGNCCPPGLHFAYVSEAGRGACADGAISSGSTVEFDKDQVVTIEGEEYYVVVFTAADKAAIKYGESLHTINGVWMDKGIITEQIAGWGEDNKVNIIVYSQGIQTYDLEHDEAMEILGEVNQENLTKWLVDGYDVNGTNVDAANEAVINDFVNAD